MSDKFALGLGKIVGNFLSLEVALRNYLYHAEHPDGEPTSAKSIWDLQPGELVAVTPYTSYDSLGRLIDKYNSMLQEEQADLKVDSSVVKLRDLIAHGRAAAPISDAREMKIVKFGPEKAGRVELELSAQMTDDWFEATISLVGQQVRKVSRASVTLPGLRITRGRGERKD